MLAKGVEATTELIQDGKQAVELEVDRRLDDRELHESDDVVSRARNAGTVISVVVIGVVALVGLLIFGEVYSAIPLDGDVFAEGDSETDPGALYGVPDDIAGGFGDAMGLVPIILIVLLASLVLAVVQRMRR